MCRKQPGICALCHHSLTLVAEPIFEEKMELSCRLTTSLAALGRLCDKCADKCVICDSFVRPTTPVHVCDECNFGASCGRCVICGAPGSSDAYYCKECTQQEKDVRNEVILLRVMLV